MAELKKSLQGYLCILVFQYASDELDLDFVDMLCSARLDGLLIGAGVDVSQIPAIYSFVRTIREEPDGSMLPLGDPGAVVGTDHWIKQVYGLYELRYMQIWADPGPTFTFGVTSAIHHIPTLPRDRHVHQSPVPFKFDDMVRSLWNFVCGEPAPPELRDALASYPDPRRIDLDTAVELIRKDLQLKTARWCSTRECAALARCKFSQLAIADCSRSA
jgi:hypothetical protein